MLKIVYLIKKNCTALEPLNTDKDKVEIDAVGR